MFGDHFYHKVISKSVAIFGTLFNNIKVCRQDSAGNITATTKVALSYGPTEKFLARLKQSEKGDDDKLVSLRMPRMGFQIESLQYDSASKLNRLNKRIVGIESQSSRNVVYQSVPYNITFSLSIMTRNQDDALQVIEQIIPYFTPEYTVTASGLEGPDTKTDIPITLQDISIPIEYEGDFVNSDRVIIYTMTFGMKIRFIGPISTQGIILHTDIDFLDKDDHDIFYEEVLVDAEDSEGGVITTEISKIDNAP